MVVDLIRGSDGSDEIYGFSSSDFLFSGSGRDTLFGGSGTDFLFADLGGGSLSGGSDSDYFVFKASDINQKQTAPTIVDYELDSDTFMVVVDANYNPFSLQQEFGNSKVYSGDTLVAEITFNGASSVPSETFSLSDISFVMPSYFDELETYLSTTLV